MSSAAAAPVVASQGVNVDARTRSFDERLGIFSDRAGHERELVCRSGAGGSRLVIDQLTDGGGDERLVAHLWPDEPGESAQVAADLYLADHDQRCRPLEDEDLSTVPLDDLTPEADACDDGQLVDAHGGSYRLAPVQVAMFIPQLRWRRASPLGDEEAVTVRDAIAGLESYEPIRALTTRALAELSLDPTISITVVRAELRRVELSPIVLNRGLREAVFAALSRGVSLSEIAIRCGRCKQNTGGSVSGETSWLSRRIGTLAECGSDAPTPWIHSDVLALIARRGLGIAPRDVELG